MKFPDGLLARSRAEGKRIVPGRGAPSLGRTRGRMSRASTVLSGIRAIPDDRLGESAEAKPQSRAVSAGVVLEETSRISNSGHSLAKENTPFLMSDGHRSCARDMLSISARRRNSGRGLRCAAGDGRGAGADCDRKEGRPDLSLFPGQLSLVDGPADLPVGRAVGRHRDRRGSPRRPRARGPRRRRQRLVRRMGQHGRHASRRAAASAKRRATR